MSKSSNTFMAFMSGATIGMLIGVLYAPDKGSNLRDRLSFKLSNYRDLLEEFITDMIKEKDSPLTTEAQYKGAKVISNAKNKAERLLEDVDDLLSQIRRPNTEKDE